LGYLEAKAGWVKRVNRNHRLEIGGPESLWLPNFFTAKKWGTVLKMSAEQRLRREKMESFAKIYFREHIFSAN
jgi:hypothetical protein